MPWDKHRDVHPECGAGSTKGRVDFDLSSFVPQRMVEVEMSLGLIPRDRGSLIGGYGTFLAKILAERGAEVSLEIAAASLEKAGLFKGFDPLKHLPKMLTDVETVNLLGCSWVTWEVWLWDNVGASCTPESRRSTRKVLGILRSGMIEVTEDQKYPAETVAKFEDFLRASVDRLLNKMSKMSNKKTAPAKMVEVRPGWPLGVPGDYDTLYREYRPFVEKVLNRYNKVGYDPEMIKDLKQFTWQKLVESNLLEKFVTKAGRRKMPVKLTALEAVEYIGCSWDDWMLLMQKDHSWLQPESGAPFSESAVFTRDQIRNVEESGLFPIKDAIPSSDMSKCFRGYLQRAIHHHFANWCRTRHRRYKERTVPDGARVIDNSRYGSAYEGDDAPWEQSLVDKESVSPESRADLLCSVVGGDLGGFLTASVERINKAVPGRQNDVFNLIADGCTLNEAIAQVRAQVRAKNRVRVG